MTGTTEYEVRAEVDGTSKRNYTMLYSTAENRYAALWVAYPLAGEHVANSSNTATWKKFPTDIIPEQWQINVWSGAYGVSYGTTEYARGHQIANADRKGIAQMQSQTYYATNSTPQIQNGFNGGIWSSLEGDIRSAIPQGDTLYVVTGPVYQTVGGSESVTLIQPQHDTKQVAVPNYYYKVVLKVKRSEGHVIGAKAIGFWLRHKVYENDSYTNYATSVDEIESKTGFDFFAALPADLQATAESNTSWADWLSF